MSFCTSSSITYSTIPINLILGGTNYESYSLQSNTISLSIVSIKNVYIFDKVSPVVSLSSK